MNVIESSQRQKEAADGALAAAIITTWKHDPAIRAEFGAVSTYAGYVTGCGKRDEVIAAAARFDARKQVTHRPIVAPRAPIVVSKVQPTHSVPVTTLAPPAISDREAGKWLSDRYKLHHAKAMARGLSYGAASDEARRLAQADREQLQAKKKDAAK
jgi:hypothetical protein